MRGAPFDEPLPPVRQRAPNEFLCCEVCGRCLSAARRMPRGTQHVDAYRTGRSWVVWVSPLFCGCSGRVVRR